MCNVMRMNSWKNPENHSKIVICIWSCLLGLVGISQLTFGAYYVSKLPIFKIGSPIWIGFLNIVLATLLFALQHNRFRQQYLCYRVNGNKSVPGTSSRISPGFFGILNTYSSLCCSATTLLLNVFHVMICEIGEWNRWMNATELQQLQTTTLQHLAVQAYRITTAQSSIAILLGIFATSYNIWIFYARKSSATDAKRGDPNPVTESTSGTVSRKVTGLQIGFDNPNWVYGDNSNSVNYYNTTTTTTRSDKPSATPPSSVRHATIRRAPSLLLSLPESCATRDQVRSASYRAVEKPRPPLSVAVQRSKTMRETSTTRVDHCEVATISQSFAQRYKTSDESPTHLNFVHDAFRDDKNASANQERDFPTKTNESAAQAPRTAIRAADKIVLRVESLRVNPAIRYESRVARNVKRCERVSSGTQTELSVLKQRSVTPGRARQSPANATVTTPTTSTTPTSGTKQKMQYQYQKITPRSSELQLSAVESSSGYSSPREPDSKSPTPEPFLMETNRKSSTESVNVTVIQIDPKPRKPEVTYAVPKKRSERGQQTVSVADDSDGSDIRLKPVTRSVSMHQSIRKSGDWKYMSPETVVNIPRPILRTHSRYNPSGSQNRRRNNPPEFRNRGLGRSSSLHVAMSEIQEKLDFIQLYSNLPAEVVPLPVQVPVHGYGYPNHRQESEDYDEPVYGTQQRRRFQKSVSRFQDDVPAVPGELPVESLDTNETLAYLSELELLARHWRTQLLYQQVELQAARRISNMDRDSFQC